MNEIPPIDYARNGDVHLAYQVFGEGELDLVILRQAFNHLELQWEEPRLAGFLTRLARFARVVVFDARGGGLSDPVVRPATLEEGADDAIAVLDEVDARRAAVLAIGGACPRAIVLAATHIARISSLVTVNGFANFPQRPPSSMTEPNWGRGPLPTDPDDWTPAFRAWVDRYRRNSIAPGMRDIFSSGHVAVRLDAREYMSAVHVPVLVCASENDLPFDGQVLFGQAMAAAFPDSRFARLPGRAHLVGWLFDDVDGTVDVISSFLRGADAPAVTDRVLATVVFSDIVGSSTRSADAGDARWRERLDDFDRLVGDAAGRYRGRVIRGTGDGHLVTFDGPSRAIGYATEVAGRARESLKLTLRTGLHTGEIELRGTDVAGLAVVIARRVMDLTPEDAVWVSSSVPPLVAGAGIGFEDRGPHELKGVPGTWELFEVTG